MSHELAHRESDDTHTAWSASEVLRKRTQALAKKRASESQEQTIQVVEFILEGASYAFQTNRLREVCTLSDVTYIPCSPPYVAGVINLRGQIIVLLKIKNFLGLRSDLEIPCTKAIIIDTGNLRVGVLVEQVVGIVAVPISSLQPGLATLTGLSADYIKGITRDRMIILDAEKMLADDRFNPQKTNRLDRAGKR